MSTVNPLTVPSKRLAASINAASSSFQLNDILGWDGAALTSADFGDQAYGVFRNSSNTLMELFEIDPTTIASASITILRRGLKFTGDRTTEVTANKLTWVKNETIVELGADVPQLFQWLKEYIDAASIAGAVDATTAAKGIVEVATTAEINAGTATGGTGASLIATPAGIAASIYGLQLPSSAQKDGLAATTTPATTNKYVTQKDFQKGAENFAADAGANDTYVITLSPVPAAYANGMVFRFKANTVNTGAATLNVNSLGAKAIVKNYNVVLADGDIKANQIVEVQYDSVGDNFQLLSPVSNSITASSGTTTHDLSNTTTNTIAHGLGVIPKIVRITMMYSQGNTDQSSTRIAMTTAVITNATQSAISVFHGSGDGATGSDSSGGATFTVRTEQGGNDYYNTAAATVDATNISITWSKNGSPTGTATIIWDAIA